MNRNKEGHDHEHSHRLHPVSPNQYVFSGDVIRSQIGRIGCGRGSSNPNREQWGEFMYHHVFSVRVIHPSQCVHIHSETLLSEFVFCRRHYRHFDIQCWNIEPLFWVDNHLQLCEFGNHCVSFHRVHVLPQPRCWMSLHWNGGDVLVIDVTRFSWNIPSIRRNLRHKQCRGVRLSYHSVRGVHHDHDGHVCRVPVWIQTHRHFPGK